GNGNGTFQSAALYNSSAANAASVVALGHNYGGPLDLAVVDDNGVSILRGWGDGTFAPAVNYSVSNNAIALAVGDFNHDRRPDIVIANYDDPGTVSILLNTAQLDF